MLLASNATVESALSYHYWRALGREVAFGPPGSVDDGRGEHPQILRVGDATNFSMQGWPASLPEARLRDLRRQVDSDGVAQVEPGEILRVVRRGGGGGGGDEDPGVDRDIQLVRALARGVEGLLRAGWPASFIVVFDEAWILVERASKVIAAATGGNRCNLDILAWMVDPNRGGAGFSPHRDRQPDDAPATFRADGSPMYATAWVSDDSVV